MKLNDRCSERSAAETAATAAVEIENRRQDGAVGTTAEIATHPQVCSSLDFGVVMEGNGYQFLGP